MPETFRYGKPCMSNLPSDLGQRIIAQIQNSSPPDVERIKKDSVAVLNTMIAERKQENAAKRE